MLRGVRGHGGGRADVQAGNTERFKVTAVPGTHQHRPTARDGRCPEQVVMLGLIGVKVRPGLEFNGAALTAPIHAAYADLMSRLLT